MRYLKLSDTGDMVAPQSAADFWRDSPEAVAQAVLTRLRLWRGEWWIDTSEGTPWMDAALGMGKRKTIEPAIRQRILETEGVRRIDAFSLSFEPESRTATLAATIDTIYGTASVREVL